MVAAGRPLWSPGGTQGWGPVSTPQSSLPFRLQLTKALTCCPSPLSWPSESTGLPSLHSVQWPRAEPEPTSQTAGHGLLPLGPPAARAGEEGRVSPLALLPFPSPSASSSRGLFTQWGTWDLVRNTGSQSPDLLPWGRGVGAAPACCPRWGAPAARPRWGLCPGPPAPLPQDGKRSARGSSCPPPAPDFVLKHSTPHPSTRASRPASPAFPDLKNPFPYFSINVKKKKKNPNVCRPALCFLFAL